MQREYRDHESYDSLTGLYRWERFIEEVRRRLILNEEGPYVLAVSDIRSFKLVNDTCGRDTGDRVLVKIAEIIRKEAPPGVCYARLEADHFAGLFPMEQLDVSRIDELLRTFRIGNREDDPPLFLHVGLYEIIDPAIPVPVMIDRARLAIAGIRNEYETRIAWYDEKIRSGILFEQKLLRALPDALERHEIRPYLQPQVDAEGKVIGAEALARWISPETGFLSPGQFIPILERSGAIAQVDRRMWEEACRILKRWKEAGREDLYLSVNLSPKDFCFLDLPEVFQNLTEDYGILPGNLRLEITETVFMQEPGPRMKVLEKLQQAGFLLEMDDFGSGYSSLSLLKDMPVDILKIDMVFLDGTKSPERARRILKCVISLSDALGMGSITEGVETVEQLKMLKEMGCRMFQGFYFDKPMSVSEFEARYL